MKMAFKKSIIFLVVLVLIGCCSGQNGADDVDKKKTTTTTEAPTTEITSPATSSTAEPTTKPTTTEAPTEPTEAPTTPPTTTQAPTSTTTAAPTTEAPTTAAPTTPAPTTPAPTTPAPTTPTTTAAPTPKPSPSPKPAPVNPDHKKWSYTDATNNQTCIIVNMALQLNFNYTRNDSQSVNVIYNIPANNTIVASGSCANTTNEIVLVWGAASANSTLSLDFALNATTSKFTLSKLQFKINATAEFADAEKNQIIELYHIGNNFTTPLSMSYHCTRIQQLNFTSSLASNETTATLSLSHVQFEAFHKQKTDAFSEAKDCDAIDTPDIVPIAVGIALATLVAVVLVAYLVARRRNTARGYMSM